MTTDTEVITNDEATSITLTEGECAMLNDVLRRLDALAEAGAGSVEGGTWESAAWQDIPGMRGWKPLLAKIEAATPAARYGAEHH